MSTHKSTIDEIRERFDNDVERFSNIETGQSATIDAPLSMELIVNAAAAATPNALAVLDLGCGAGNYTVRLLQRLGPLDCTLVDLSHPMLERAELRVLQAGAKSASSIQSDLRNLTFEEGTFDVVLAAAVLHHLRSEAEFELVFVNINKWLRPGGSFWIFDLLDHQHPAVQKMMWERYGEYLLQFGGEEYRDKVFCYIEKEDTPISLTSQLSLLQRVGFSQVDVLHKNGPFAAFGAAKQL